MSRVIYASLRVEPDDDDGRTNQEILEKISEGVIESMPGDGIGIAVELKGQVAVNDLARMGLNGQVAIFDLVRVLQA